MTGGTSHAALAMDLPSDARYLCAVRAFIGEVCRRHGFAEMQTSQVVLAVDEALANVMKHGYGGRPDGRISLRISAVADGVKGPGLSFTIDDWGRQVDPSSIRSRDLADIRPGGLGVHIIRQVMDSAQYETPANQGMRLTMVKFLSSPAVCGPGAEDRCCGGLQPGPGSCASRKGEGKRDG
ncbi:MAG: ATP-binding protein [Phycisphaerales bacterium]